MKPIATVQATKTPTELPDGWYYPYIALVVSVVTRGIWRGLSHGIVPVLAKRVAWTVTDKERRATFGLLDELPNVETAIKSGKTFGAGHWVVVQPREDSPDSDRASQRGLWRPVGWDDKNWSMKAANGFHHSKRTIVKRLVATSKFRRNLKPRSSFCSQLCHGGWNPANFSRILRNCCLLLMCPSPSRSKKDTFVRLASGNSVLVVGAE